MTEERLSGHAHAGADPAAKHSEAAAISRGIVQLMHGYTGRGPTKARTTVNTNLVAVVLGETLTRGEANLVQSGQRDAVLSMRRTYHDAIRAEASELVEEIMGRTVTSTLADIDLEADVAALLFILEAQPESGLAETAETSSPEPPE
jgi:uncharacterized protein YbcI